MSDGSWKVTKEILGWIIDTEKGTIQLPPCRLVELKDLLDIPDSLWRMSVKKLCALIRKLRSMQVPSAIRHFYHIQAALTKAYSGRRAYLSQAFHAEIAHWRHLCDDTLSRPAYIVEVVQRLATALGYCDASGKGAGGVWFDLNGDGVKFVWRLQWPEDIVADLVSWTNTKGRITNSELKLAALILQESCFSLVCANSKWHALATGSGSMPTVSWTFKEASIINPVMADLLRLRSTMNRTNFYHHLSSSTLGF